MWPVGANDMSDEPDLEWVNAIGSGKTYMMGVSPWFFHSAKPGTDWVWRGDDLWADRWNEVMNVDPQFVQYRPFPCSKELCNGTDEHE